MVCFVVVGGGTAVEEGGRDSDRSWTCPPSCDETELMDVAVERILALPEDLELVVETDNLVWELPWLVPIFPCCTSC